ncbi:MGH1-like glycoside hydrolase domain-containing protein [Flavihumibacter fluvii]|uniref:MGH1-like glycoside hydrolase domain-containing protein n=1 Tax=Flavihumibacter fluvii TaxID=2838157 RepID=UPI001BDF4DD4|nr:glycosyl hydrolase family 65 protein [Flavihumibacter fluvii]ULQ53254.1 hypothetical protein KJS93_02855 [Flavihumibacter fluvii]
MTSSKITVLVFYIACLMGSSCKQADRQPVLSFANYKHFIDSFNANDNELYPQFITNEKSRDFLSKNIPLFDCPDSMFLRTYYFRWWTYRKHIKKTPEGFVISEFLPAVPWAGKYNTINCAAALHIYEGSWLHDQQFVNDYENFWLKGGGSIRAYSFPVANAMLRQAEVTNNTALAVASLPALVENYTAWEKEKLDSNGLFWQVDGNDGMEVSIGGSGSIDNAGYRATINSYMYGDAKAIADIAILSGQPELAARFTEKASLIKQHLQNKLWDDTAAFFKVLPKDKNATLCSARELHGYTPWFFNLPDTSFSRAWKFLMDPTYFFAPYGPTTAEQRHPDFTIAYEGHECQWNGPSWPMATSITLTALANFLNNNSQENISKADYFKLLGIYANSHQLKRSDGKTVPWIDENLNPYTGDWISRTRLKTWNNGTWSKEKGGMERGKDYNHSSFCDLVISGLVGLRPALGDRLVVNPLIPGNSWGYFCLDNIAYHGKLLTILYDKTGGRYKRGKGFHVFINGKKAASAPTIQKIELTIN